jgi:hypothetical protein
MYKSITETFKNVRLESATPITTTLPNLIKVEKEKNILIVNLEKNTSITTIINQSIYNVDIIQEGMGEILEKINEKENSYSKSYEVCKNTTIYTMETAIEDTTNTENLQYIVPVLYKVVEEIKRIKENYKKIDEIYLTGMGTVINNVDLYFKEYFRESKVEILKPSGKVRDVTGSSDRAAAWPVVARTAMHARARGPARHRR